MLCHSHNLYSHTDSHNLYSHTNSHTESHIVVQRLALSAPSPPSPPLSHTHSLSARTGYSMRRLPAGRDAFSASRARLRSRAFVTSRRAVTTSRRACMPATASSP